MPVEEKIKALRSGGNYTKWAEKMMALLAVHGVSGFIDGTATKYPHPEDIEQTLTESEKMQASRYYDEYCIRTRKAVSLIHTSLSSALQQKYPTSKYLGDPKKL